MGGRLREVRSLRKDRWLYVASRKQHRNRTCKLTERVLKLDHLLFIQNISTFLIGYNPRLILHNQLALTMCVFHSTKTSALNIRLLPVANGTAYSNLARYTQIFESFLPEVFFIQLCSWNFQNFRLNGSHFRNSAFFPRNFCTIFRCSQIFESFG